MAGEGGGGLIGVPGAGGIAWGLGEAIGLWGGDGGQLPQREQIRRAQRREFRRLAVDAERGRGVFAGVAPDVAAQRAVELWNLATGISVPGEAGYSRERAQQPWGVPAVDDAGVALARSGTFYPQLGAGARVLGVAPGNVPGLPPDVQGIPAPGAPPTQQSVNWPDVIAYLIRLYQLWEQQRAQKKAERDYARWLRQLLEQLAAQQNTGGSMPYLNRSFVGDITPAGASVGGGMLGGWGGVLAGALGGALGAILPGGAPASARSFALPDIPGISVGPDLMSALGCPTQPFGTSTSRSAPQTFMLPSPSTGKPVWFKPAGRPLLWSGDLTACKRVRKLAGRARRRVGGR